MDAFQGDRVADLKKRQRAEAAITPVQRLARVAGNLREANPGTLLLIALFIPLTFLDVFFNISRGFICSLPELCDPMMPG